MSRYEKTFAELEKKKEGAFIPFVVLGDPDFETSKKILEKMAENADILELGFPFSDPIADGKRIQAADERSLKSGITPEKCFELIKYIRKKHANIPVGLLLYYNLVYSNGVENFLKKAKSAGVDGLLVADMPIEESGEMQKACEKIGLEQIFIIAPTTKGNRIKKIASKAKGFIYTVGVLGVTGERKSIEDSTVTLVKLIKKNSKVPVCVGFGISKPEHVKKIINGGADGAIIGSAVETIIENNLKDVEKMLLELENFLKKMKEATK
ncbi:MAG: tryptophan synthase subunit alpha [archaeon]|nr:tryptophan synthase subunit alpha [archaeon]